MQGNGGSVSAKAIAEQAVNTVMSGPASGVMAAAAVARAVDIDRVITYDMGGTSSDVGLCLDGVPQVTAEMEIEYALPIHVPMVDVHSIGAGGGSIAWIDEAGLLRVGPESAGARPGPICYGHGGERPTITDANLLLGRLKPRGLLAVDRPVSTHSIAACFEQVIGKPLGLDAIEAAAAVLRVGNNLMAGAIRMVSLARGHDPRDFTLFAFGGAGPMHAMALAAELGIPKVLIPARPGITNAIGCIAADLRHDYVNTVNQALRQLDIEEARAILKGHIEMGRAAVERDGIAVEAIEFLHFADMQFQGQTHMLTVPISGPSVSLAELQEAFDEAYWERFAVELPEIRAVLVNLHTAAIGRRRAIDLAALAGRGGDGDLRAAETGQRAVWFADGWRETPVYDRGRLPRGATLEGPAIIEQLDCTSVIEPGNAVCLDDFGNLIVEVKP